MGVRGEFFFPGMPLLTLLSLVPPPTPPPRPSPTSWTRQEKLDAEREALRKEVEGLIAKQAASHSAHSAHVDKRTEGALPSAPCSSSLRPILFCTLLSVMVAG